MAGAKWNQAFNKGLKKAHVSRIEEGEEPSSTFFPISRRVPLDSPKIEQKTPMEGEQVTDRKLRERPQLRSERGRPATQKEQEMAEEWEKSSFEFTSWLIATFVFSSLYFWAKW